ncbi:surfeit locus protein 6 homolog [Anabrus simplex]|uniref:surfeit locus protein 6 homolog n=1 Tax=Anabrus simplex TaxID=316456 RepID=UPI0035A2B9B8
MVKSMKLVAKDEANKLKMFDVKLMRKKLLFESKFITDLWKKLPIPVSAQQYVTDSAEEEDGDSSHHRRSNEKLRPFLLHGEGSTRAKSLEELHNKLEEMKGKKLMYKEKLLKKGLKNRLTKKKKKEERKLKKSLLKVKKSKGEFEDKIKPTVKPAKPIYNSEGKIVFSKFDFTESSAAAETIKKKDKEPRDPQKILQKLQKQKEKLKKLENEGEVEKANELKEKLAWKNALKKAEGIKVKDDPELLKKTLKKHKERKKQSKKKWAAREEKVKQMKDEKQRKRTDNILQRKKEKKLNKLKKAAKKGRVIPGF